MKRAYQISEKRDSRALSEFLAKDGQLFLPMLELIEQSALAVDELIDVMGRATIEAVLLMSAEQVAGPRAPGKKGSGVRWHGRQAGAVALSERKLKVAKPRLRKKGQGAGGEVAVPAYEAMRNDTRLGERMRDILMRGVSTRKYKEVLPEMAQSVGIAKSSVGRQFIEASQAQLKALCERRFDEVDLLVIYVDGQVFGEHQVLTAVGVDNQGRKHALGVAGGASENAVAATSLLEDLVARGVPPRRKRRHRAPRATGPLAGQPMSLGRGEPARRAPGAVHR